MTVRITDRITRVSSRARRGAAAVALGLLVGACGDASYGTEASPWQVGGADAPSGQPVLVVSASELAFAETPVSGHECRAVTLTNVGGGNLIVTDVQVDGADFTVADDQFPVTLAAEESAELTISFIPAATGAAAARIAISSNDYSSPVVLTAIGTGVVASAQPAPAEPQPTSTFSWTKPPDFDSMLQSAIQQQPSFMGGYGGQVTNPFPQLPGTVKFSGMQVTTTDAIILGNHFGRPSFRFYADATSKHSNGLRAEFTGGADYQFTPGQTFKYEFSSYFPSEYKNSSWTEWNMFAQFHGPGFPAWGLHTAGGYLHMAPPWAAANAYRIPMPARNRWHDFSWTIRWAHDGSGYATLSLNGTVVFDYHGATMHSGEAYYYPKFGSYLANNPYTQVTYSTPWKITRL
jgi:hypothetical protein